MLSGASGFLPEGFVRQTRELMLRRAQVAIILGASITAAFIGVDELRIAPDRYPKAVGLRIAGIALLLPLLVVTRMKSAVHWSEWIAGGGLAIVMATTASIMPLFDGVDDPQYAIQGTGIVLCILGSGLLLPFDAPEMLLLGLFALACHVAFTFDFPLAQNFPVLVATLCAVVIATVGARELTRSRLAEFEGQRAREELLRARSDFVAMLTHDIRNPLAAIDGFVQMMRETPTMPTAEREELLASVQRSVRTAIALAVNFLEASKIEAAGVNLKRRTVDLAELLTGVLADHAVHADKTRVVLLNDSETGLPALEADGAALARVFANLVGNAIKHTPAGGTVRIAARRSATDRIEIIVEDTGEGIPSGQETRIFERYTHAASRTDSTGLGLFIARTLTTAHGGTIRAENRDDRTGARFSVVLPVRSDESAGLT